jgi:hypothetical protein
LWRGASREAAPQQNAGEPGNEDAAEMGKDMSGKKQDNIGKGSKQRTKTVARASARTIKKLLKTEKGPAVAGNKSRGIPR